MELTEESGVQFPAFPFEPYPIQLQFMKAVYSGIQKGGVTIVESPTGTYPMNGLLFQRHDCASFRIPERDFEFLQVDERGEE